jgi:hypothetical protein
METNERPFKNKIAFPSQELPTMEDTEYILSRKGIRPQPAQHECGLGSPCWLHIPSCGGTLMVSLYIEKAR